MTTIKNSKVKKIEIKDRNSFETLITKLKPEKILLITNNEIICTIAQELVTTVFRNKNIAYQCFIISNLDSNILKVRNGVDAFWTSDADMLLTIGDELFRDVAKTICIIVANNQYEGTASIDGIKKKRIRYPLFISGNHSFDTHHCKNHIP